MKKLKKEVKESRFIIFDGCYRSKNAKDVEDNLQNLLQYYDVDRFLTLEEIRQKIYEESGPTRESLLNFNSWWKFFIEPKTKDKTELQVVINCFQDAWNHFPHRDLNDATPIDILMYDLELLQEQLDDILQNMKKF